MTTLKLWDVLQKVLQNFSTFSVIQSVSLQLNNEVFLNTTYNRDTFLPRGWNKIFAKLNFVHSLKR